MGWYTQGKAIRLYRTRGCNALQCSEKIMRAFVRLRRMLSVHRDLERKLTALEQRYDEQFKVVFDAIRALMTPPAKPRKKIGFEVKEKKAAYGHRGIKRKKADHA